MLCFMGVRRYSGASYVKNWISQGWLVIAVVFLCCSPLFSSVLFPPICSTCKLIKLMLGMLYVLYMSASGHIWLNPRFAMIVGWNDLFMRVNVLDGMESETNVYIIFGLKTRFRDMWIWYLDMDGCCILFLKSVHKLIVCPVTRSMHPDNVEMIFKLFVCVYALFIRICFILYLDLLFYNVITGCVFIVDEGVMYPDLFSFHFML